MSATYQIIKEDKYHNREVLSTGVTQGDAEYALLYDGGDPTKVKWNNTPIERPDPRGGGWSLVYVGIYNG